MQTLGHAALSVRDYDEALTFLTRTLNFSVQEDARFSEDKPRVLIGPPGSRGSTSISGSRRYPERASRLGNQTGGRVFLFLPTDDFWRDYREMTARKLKFVREPREETYGAVAVFEDLYGYVGLIAAESRPSPVDRTVGTLWNFEPAGAFTNYKITR